MIKYKGEFYCDTKDAATLLDVPEYTIRRLINSDNPDKKIKAEKIPGNKKSYVIPFDDLIEYAKKNGKELTFQANIKKLKLKPSEKKSLFGIMGKALPFVAGGSLLGAALATAFTPIAAFAGVGMAAAAAADIIASKSSHGASTDDVDVEHDQVNDTHQETGLTTGESTADIVKFSLSYFNDQSTLLNRSPKELRYLSHQTEVSLQGIDIGLEKAETIDEKELLKVMWYALKIQEIKIKSILRKLEKVSK